MVTANLLGGLGNKMFQIASAYSLSLDNNENCLFEPTEASNAHGNIDTYRDNIFRNVKLGQITNNPTNYQEVGFHYSPIPYNGNLRLLGYYQSEKYFKHNKNKILELFSIDDTSKKIIINKYGNLLKGNTCSLHIRRGDYLNLPNHHPPCNLKYYNNAIKLFDDDTTFLVISNDILWCKEVFGGRENFIFVEDNTDYIDMWLMSLCDNNIIANSSFSWWGAWLNKNEDKKVIAPKKWFGPAISHDIKDLIPSSWTTL